jgi:hypothetical protein
MVGFLLACSVSKTIIYDYNRCIYNLKTPYLTKNFRVKIKKDETGTTLARMEEIRSACDISIEKSEGKGPPGRTNISENNIKMYIRGVPYEGVDWTKPIHAGYSSELV